MSDPERRNTRQRQIVLEELQKLTSHPTAAELYDIVRRRLPRISLGTVYRNLELLTRLGTIQKLDVAGDEARFDANARPHAHIRCVRCDRVDDILAPPLDLFGGLANDSAGYQVLDCCLQYRGICPKCRGSSSNTACEPSAEEIIDQTMTVPSTHIEREVQ